LFNFLSCRAERRGFRMGVIGLFAGLFRRELLWRLYAQSFFDIVRNRAGLVRIGARVPQVGGDIGRLEDAFQRGLSLSSSPFIMSRCRPAD